MDVHIGVRELIVLLASRIEDKFLLWSEGVELPINKLQLHNGKSHVEIPLDEKDAIYNIAIGNSGSERIRANTVINVDLILTEEDYQDLEQRIHLATEAGASTKAKHSSEALEGAGTVGEHVSWRARVNSWGLLLFYDQVAESANVAIGSKGNKSRRNASATSHPTKSVRSQKRGIAEDDDEIEFLGMTVSTFVFFVL